MHDVNSQHPYRTTTPAYAMNHSSLLLANAFCVPAHRRAWTGGSAVRGPGGAGVVSMADSILQ
jgi:hypothetical protein